MRNWCFLLLSAAAVASARAEPPPRLEVTYELQRSLAPHGTTVADVIQSA